MSLEIAFNSSMIPVRKSATFCGWARKVLSLRYPQRKKSTGVKFWECATICKFLVFPNSNGKSHQGNFEHTGHIVLVSHLVERLNRPFFNNWQHLVTKHGKVAMVSHMFIEEKWPDPPVARNTGPDHNLLALLPIVFNGSVRVSRNPVNAIVPINRVRKTENRFIKL